MTNVAARPPLLDAAPNPEAVPRLAVRPREAAEALGIGQRLLWTWTNSGEIPHIRLGTAILYPVAALEDWLAQQVQEGKR